MEILHGFALGIIRRFRGKERLFVQEDHALERICSIFSKTTGNWGIERQHGAAVPVKTEGGQQLRRVGKQVGNGLGVVLIFKHFSTFFQENMVSDKDKQNKREQNSNHKQEPECGGCEKAGSLAAIRGIIRFFGLIRVLFLRFLPLGDAWTGICSVFSGSNRFDTAFRLFRRKALGGRASAPAAASRRRPDTPRPTPRRSHP